MNTPTSHTPVTLITGGRRRLGKSMALKLDERGIDVVLTYRGSRTEAEGVVAQIEQQGRRAVALQLDVGVSSTFTTRDLCERGRARRLEASGSQML